MTTYQNTMPEGVARYARPIVPFSDTFEATERRRVRATIRKSSLSKNQIAVLEYLVNLWFVHRKKGGQIYPGAERIAQKVKLSLRTVKAFLAQFRDLAFIKAVAYAKGGRKATRYVVDLGKIDEILDPANVEVIDGTLSELQEAPKTRKYGLSQVIDAFKSAVKTVQNLHTVKNTAERIHLLTADDIEASGYVPFHLPPSEWFSHLASDGVMIGGAK